jgi:hypothetical protein
LYALAANSLICGPLAGIKLLTRLPRVYLLSRLPDGGRHISGKLKIMSEEVGSPPAAPSLQALPIPAGVRVERQPARIGSNNAAGGEIRTVEYSRKSQSKLELKP